MAVSIREPRERRAQFPFDLVPEYRRDEGIDSTQRDRIPEERDRDFGRFADGVPADAPTAAGERF
jgi:hypothetical protein